MHRVSPRFRVNALVALPRSGLSPSSCACTAALKRTAPDGARLPQRGSRDNDSRPTDITHHRLDWPPKRLRARKPVSGRDASLSSGQEVSADRSSGGDPERRLSTNRPRPDQFDPTFLERCVYTLCVGFHKFGMGVALLTHQNNPYTHQR